MADPIIHYGTTISQALDKNPQTIRPDLRQSAGLGALPPATGITLADIELEHQQALNRIAGLGAASAPRLRPPPEAGKQMTPGPGIYYSPGLDRFAVGDIEFGRQDYDIALQAAPQAGQRTGSPTTPGDWRRISQREFQGYLNTISEGRGFFGNLGAGAQITGEAVVGGIGRGLQMLGAEQAGQALVGAGEAIGLSPAEEARSAAIYERQTPLQRFGTGLVQAVPSLVASVVPGVGAAGLAVRAGAAAGGALARTAAAGGAATTVLPMHIFGSWEAAERNPNLDTSDPEVQTEILMSALTKTGIDLIGQDFAIRGLSAGLRGIISENARKSTRLKRALGAGAAEGTAELLTEVVDQIVFDEDSRAALSKGDWAALWPILTQKYGEQNLMAFGIGAALGGGLGALSPGPTVASTTPPPEQTPSPNRDLTGTDETDVLNPQATPPLALPAPPLALPAPSAPYTPSAPPGTQGEMFPGVDLGQTPAEPMVLTPEQRVGRQLELPFPEAAAPVETQLELPLQASMGTQADLFGTTPPFPQAAPPAPPTAPPDFVPGTVPVQPISTQRTDLPPGAARLRTRPSERVETYAPTPAAAPETALGAQINRLLQQQRARQEAEQAAQAQAAQAAAQEAAQRTQRENQLLRARREQVQLEQDTNILGEELVGGDFDILGVDARAKWDAAVAALDPEVRAEVLTGDPKTLAGNQAQADLARLGAELRNRRSNKLRRQRAEPPTIIEPEAAPSALPEGVFGTKDGKPFMSELAARGQRKRVASRENVPVERLEPVEVTGGWGLQVLPETPPEGGAPKGGEPDAVRKQGAKESTLRKGSKTGKGVRGKDTKGQKAARAREAEAEEVVAPEYPPLAGSRSEAFGTFNRVRYKRRGDQYIEERRVDEVDGGRIQKPGTWKYSSTLLTKEQADARYAKRQEEGFDRETAVDLEALPEGLPPRRRQTPEPEPEPEPEAPTIKRGDSAPTDMGVTEAWDKYVKPFLIAPVERTAISKGAFASQWSDAVKAGRGNVTTAISILRQTTSYPPLEAQAILSLDPAVTPVDEDTREAALWTLMETAFTSAEGGTPVKALGNKRPIPFAQDVLSEHAWTKADKEALLDFATEETIAAARAQPNPTEQMRALNRLLAGTGVLNTANDADADTISNPASDLVDEIVGYNEAPHIAEGWEQNRLRELVRAFNKYASQNPEAYGSVVEIQKDAEGNQVSIPIYQYINNQGYVNFQGGRIVPNPKATDPRTQERMAAAPEQVERGGAGLASMTPRGTRTKGEGRFSQIDLNDISNAIDTDGKPIRGAMPLGKQKMVAKSFLKRLRNAPRMYMFKDQADLLKRNPALHARAAGARAQGDFDQAPAAGYSFGNGEVIIFTDRIANEQHLKFVLAHETFGHYGLRGILPNAEFDKVMEGLYDLDSSIQRGVDTAMEANPDLGKAEAVEEFLSDYAAVLDTRLILRVWNAIKDALNKLGISFKDDSVRYLLSQARRYARSPQRGFATDLNEIARDLRSVEYGTAPGRYKPASEGFKDMRTIGETARMGLELPTSLQEGLDAMQGKWGDFDNNWRKFKSTFLSLGTFDSRVNPGSKRLHDILQEASDIAMSVRDRLNTTMRVALNRGIAGTGLFGKSAADYERVNNLLHHARIRAIMALREAPDKGRAPLVEYDKATGTYKPTDELERLDNLYRLKFEDARDGFSYTFKNIDEDGNVQGEETISVPGIDGLTRDSEIWRSYEAARKAYIDTEVQLLIAQLSAGTIREKSALKEIGSVVPDARLNTEERALMRRAIRRYKELYEAGSSINSEGAIVYVDKSTELANEFAKAFNMAVIANKEAASDAEAKARNDAVKKFFDQPIQDDVVAEIEAFKKRASEGAGFGADRFIVQRAITSLHTQSMQEGGSGEFLRRSVVAQYSPIVREGAYETRTRAVDVRTGKPVALDAGFKDGLVYAQFATMSEANAFRKKAAEAFGDTPYTVRARGPDGQMQEIEVRFEFVTGEVLVEAATPLKVNVNEFVAGLNYFGISIRPEKREEIIQALTRQDSRARNRLLAGLNPGDARDAIAGIAKHIDGRASTIAKTLTRPKVDELMSPRIAESRLLWEGNKPKVDALRANLDALRADPNASDKTINVAQREYDEALMMYKWTNPEPGVSRRTEALNKAASLLKFLDQNASVNDSDLEASGLVSTWRSYTSLVQLGGSIATGLLNPVSVYTNGVPYLASYNSKTAFGGGFGGRALIEVNRAFAQVGVPGMKNLQGMNTAEFWREVQSNPALQKKHKVSAREAEMIALQIREGRMIPAQHNALVSTSRGRTTRDAFSKAIDLWMSPFNLTEQASRRAFGLASFRLEYQRQLQGIDPTLDRNSAEYTIAEQAAYDRAVDFTTRALDVALGDYAVMNRPAFFRAGLPGLIYMYKVFPTTSIQMFRNLSPNGKMVMLAALWLLGGVAAFPFAEDLEDLTDTLMQMAGVGEGSVRAWMATNLIEPIAPGMSPVVFRGLLSDYFGGDIAGRVSLSPLPGTDMFVAGADVSRALGEIAGPIPSALGGTVQFAKDLVRAPFSTTVTAEQVLREAPVTALRMAGDAYAYTQAGAIIDRRGYVVSPDVSGAEILVRLLGFYPTRAAEEYGNIRVIKRVADYRREAVTSFRQAWVSARVRNDRGRMREIEQAVRDWNNYHRGGPLVIDNFRQGSVRAYREAIRPAVERTLRTTPLSSREYLERATDLMTR